MHELSIAQSIFDIAVRHIPDGDSRQVRTVRVRVGELAGVVTDSLDFCFHAITTGTRLAGATLAIEEIPVTAECSACGAAFRVEDSRFACPACESPAIVITAGRELHLTEIELDDDPPHTP